MSDEQPDRDRGSLEQALRAIADEVTTGAERLASGDLGNLEDLARASGLDAEPIRQFAEDAGSWLRDQIAQATQTGGDVEPMPSADASDPRGTVVPHDRRAPLDDPMSARAAGLPHPLDLPTERQARALAALQAGRWTVEPGTVVLTTSLNRGPGPEDAHALGMELHVRDWVDVDGELTIAGERALARWARAEEARGEEARGEASSDDAG